MSGRHLSATAGTKQPQRRGTQEASGRPAHASFLLVVTSNTTEHKTNVMTISPHCQMFGNVD